MSVSKDLVILLTPNPFLGVPLGSWILEAETRHEIFRITSYHKDFTKAMELDIRATNTWDNQCIRDWGIETSMDKLLKEIYGK